MRKTESQKISLCGMLGALSVVLLLIGSALQIGTYAAPMLAAFLIIPVLEEYGPRYALTLYATVSILAVLFVPETELAFFYVLVMGYYPVLRIGRAAGRRNGHAGGAVGRGKSVILAVRPGAGGADAILSFGGQAKTEEEVLMQGGT